jgi:hypothetical protein
MIKLFTSYNLWETGMLQGVLEQQGIASVIRNEHLVNTSGYIRPDTWPELWVLHDTDAERATQLLEEWQKTRPESDVATAWTCAHCGETIEGEFDACWNCSQPRPE